MTSKPANPLTERRFDEETADLPAIIAPGGEARLDDTGGSLISSVAPVLLLADDLMADGRTISTEGPPLEGVVCPFCAHVRSDSNGSCPKCTMEDTPTTRRSTGERIGPWFVLQRKNPTAPGLRFSVLLTLARRGHVTPKSIVRGPTTGQLWRYAGQVKGLSRVFGICWHCNAGVSPDATNCPRCRSAQEIPDDPDQFLESYAALPVMREVPAIDDGRDTGFDARGDRAADRPTLPARRESPEPSHRPGTRELATRDAAARPGVTSRSITLQRDNDHPILSASELAAAFNLDVPSPGFARRTSRRLWTVTKVSALLLLFVGGATATTLYFKPDWRLRAEDAARPYWNKTQAWTAQLIGRPQKKPATLLDLDQLPPITPIQLEPTGSNGTSSSIDSTDNVNPNKVASDRNAVFKAPQPRAASVWSPTSQPASTSIVGTDAPIDALAGQTSMFLPTTRSSSTPSPVLTDLPNLVDKIVAKDEAGTAAEKANPSKPANTPIVSVPPSELTLEEAIRQASELRNSALDAEARRDWKAAVLLYEQIGMLPEEAHPSDLKVKLSVARERARS